MIVSEREGIVEGSMTEADEAALRAEVEEVMAGVLRHPFSTLGIDREHAEAFTRVMKDLVLASLVEGWTRGYAAARQRAESHEGGR